MSAKGIVEVEDDDSVEDKTSKSVNYNNEQKIVAAVWMHEKQFNNQSIEDIKNNFKIRFKLTPPSTKTLVLWENQLFLKGNIKKEESGTDDNLGDNDLGEDQFSDIQTSEEENSD